MEQSSAPETDTEVQTVLGSLSKPMVNADVNASSESVSVMGEVICDDLHLWPEMFFYETINYWVQHGAASCQHQNHGIKNQWYSWRKKHNACTVL